MIILLFPSSMRISNQSIVNQNYIENEDLVSTVDFRRFAFNQRYLGKGLLRFTRSAVYIRSTSGDTRKPFLTIQDAIVRAKHHRVNKRPFFTD